MARAKVRRPAPAGKQTDSAWRISEDWLATGIGIALILVIRLADISIHWPLFEWFKK